MAKYSIKDRATVDLSKSKNRLIKPVKTVMTTVILEDELFARFKAKVATDRITIKSFITEAIEKYLEE